MTWTKLKSALNKAMSPEMEIVSSLVSIEFADGRGIRAVGDGVDVIVSDVIREPVAPDSDEPTEE
jgi:hypothetical protein